MEYKLLEEQDLQLMLDFVDDENTLYNIEDLRIFVNEKNCYGFIAKKDNQIIGFAYGYVLLKPNGRKCFYLDAIDITKKYQNNGYGRELISFIKEYVKKIGCYEIFLITNKSNTSACKCYEKSGAKYETTDDIVYIYNLKGDK